MIALRIALIALLSPGLAVGQETTGHIRGRLRSTAGDPIEGARITATSPDLLGARRAASARDGVFQLLGLPPGTYALQVAAIGFRPLRIQAVQVQLGKVSGLGEVRLEPAAVTLSELVITAPRVTLDPVRTTVGGILEAEDYSSLPTERDYKSLITILPHINTSYHGDPANSAGSTGLENMYFIDGTNVTSPLDATRGTSLPYNFIRSVEVRAGGYEAQFGKALGAIVNAVTYTGTNDFEANVFGFFTHSALAWEPKAQPTLRETGAYSYDFGARVSGPVARDRLWFSAAYNPRVDHADKEIIGLGKFPDTRRAHIFAGKLTWKPSAASNVEFSVLGDPTTHQLVKGRADLTPLNPLPFLKHAETGGVTASLRATAALGSSLLLEAAVERLTGRDRIAPEGGGTEPLVLDFFAHTSEGNTPYGTTELSRTGARLRGTLSTGRHTVIGGAEYENNRVLSEFGFVGGRAIYRIDEATFLVDSQYSRGENRNRVPTLSLQDSWRLSERLTLNAGLRWSGQYLTGASGRVAQSFPDEWQPRLGFSWQLGREGKHRVFGSFGRFYQQEPLFVSTIFYVDYAFTLSHYSADPRQPGVTPDRVDTLSTREAAWAPITGLKAEHFDEFTVGYERLLGATSRLTIRGIRRDLRSSFQFGLDSTFHQVLGTPGKGDFAFLPSPRRQYTALEAGIEGTRGRLAYRAFYVLSRTWGNYPGLYDSDQYFVQPGGISTSFVPHQAKNSTGLLPNDRTHVFKLVATFRPTSALTAGAFLTWQSGTPITEFGAGPMQPWPAFVSRRGSTGRTPALWDFNLRFSYAGRWTRASEIRVVLDVLHVGNPRTAVRVDQQHYFALDEDGNQTNVNPAYKRATAFQPPMTARVGLELSF